MRHRNKGSEFYDVVRNIFWRIIETGIDIQPDILEEAIKSFCESYSFDSSKAIISLVFEKCITEIDKVIKNIHIHQLKSFYTQQGSKNTLSVLKVIYKIVESMFPSSSFSDSFSKKEAVSFLFINKTIVHYLVNNIRLIKKQILEANGNSTNLSE